MQKKPNILFIALDALRKENLGCYGYFRNTSPNIDSLAKKGVLFDQAYSSNNATEKSFLAILSGRHILLENSKNLLLTSQEINNFFSSGGIFLQEILKKKGYKTYCLKELYGWQKKGFDLSYSGPELNENKKGGLYFLKKLIPLRSIVRRVNHYLPKKISGLIKARYGRTNGLKATEDAIKIIKESKRKKQNFFMWIDYNDTHIPYNPKEFTGKFKSKNKGKPFFKIILKKKNNPLVVGFWKDAFNRKDTIKDIIDRYDSAIFYDDYLIGKIINALKEQKIFDETIIFLFSDHGESFFEHEIYFDHHGLYDVSTNFPFIISGPGIPRDKRIGGFVQHEDFITTIFHLLKIEYDPFFFDGKNLLSLINNGEEARREVFMEEGDKVKKKAIRNKEYKYIQADKEEDALCRYCNKIHGGVVELYNLKQDPGEKNNLSEKNKKDLIKFRLILENEIKNRKKLNEKRRIKKTLPTINKKVYKELELV